MIHVRRPAPAGRFHNVCKTHRVPNPITSYAREVQQELLKVIWPTRRELTIHTLLVIGVSIGLAVFIGVVDYLATLGLEQFLRLR